MSAAIDTTLGRRDGRLKRTEDCTCDLMVQNVVRMNLHGSGACKRVCGDSHEALETRPGRDLQDMCNMANRARSNSLMWKARARAGLTEACAARQGVLIAFVQCQLSQPVRGHRDLYTLQAYEPPQAQHHVTIRTWTLSFDGSKGCTRQFATRSVLALTKAAWRAPGALHHDEQQRASRWPRVLRTSIDDGPNTRVQGANCFKKPEDARHQLRSWRRSWRYADVRCGLTAHCTNSRALILHPIAAHHGFARSEVGMSGCGPAGGVR